MACFLVPAAEAVVTTVATKRLEKKEKLKEDVSGHVEEMSVPGAEKHPFVQKLNWLNYMLWGGTILLLLEHIWHGEVTLVFPFFTALGAPGGWMVMLGEMATVGVAMAAFVTAAWAVMVGVSVLLERRRTAQDLVG